MNKLISNNLTNKNDFKILFNGFIFDCLFIYLSILMICNSKCFMINRARKYMLRVCNYN